MSHSFNLFSISINILYFSPLPFHFFRVSLYLPLSILYDFSPTNSDPLFSLSLIFFQFFFYLFLFLSLRLFPSPPSFPFLCLRFKTFLPFSSFFFPHSSLPHVFLLYKFLLFPPLHSRESPFTFLLLHSLTFPITSLLSYRYNHHSEIFLSNNIPFLLYHIYIPSFLFPFLSFFSIPYTHFLFGSRSEPLPRKIAQMLISNKLPTVTILFRHSDSVNDSSFQAQRINGR